MHAFFWLTVRAFTKLGIAMAASNPMIATTIIISTSVKPPRRDDSIRIVLPSTFLIGGVNRAQAVYINNYSFTVIACTHRYHGGSTSNAMGHLFAFIEIIAVRMSHLEPLDITVL